MFSIHYFLKGADATYGLSSADWTSFHGASFLYVFVIDIKRFLCYNVYNKELSKGGIKMAVVLLISVAYALCGYAMVFAWHLFVLRGERYDPDYFKCKANRASIITAPAFGIFLGGFMFIFALPVFH